MNGKMNGKMSNKSLKLIREKAIADYVEKFNIKMAGETEETARGWVLGIGDVLHDNYKKEVWKRIALKHGYKGTL